MPDPLWKILLDRSVALAMLVCGAPLFVLLAILVKLSSKGPVLYRQERAGAGGVPFTILKFRTMVADAEKSTGPVWAQSSDPRITSLGRILRATHLDELPQLFNVLHGEMSLVGPRPERPYFVEKLQADIPSYVARLAVKPGVTGLAQVLHVYDCDLRSARRKVAYDRLYIQRRSLGLDLWIILKTAIRMMSFAGGPKATTPASIPGPTARRSAPRVLERIPSRVA